MCFGGSVFCSNKTHHPFSVWLLLTLYSCGNVIVLVIVHLINNWFMMILVAVYVYLKINATKSPSLWRIISQVWKSLPIFHIVHRLPFV